MEEKLMSNYDVNNKKIETILSWINEGIIAIPEIQRPFVWDSTKVRDLIDSLYKDFPIGYLIIWQNPDVKLRDGSVSAGKKSNYRWAAENNSYGCCINWNESI